MAVVLDFGAALWARGFSPVPGSRRFLSDLGTGLKPRAHRWTENVARLNAPGWCLDTPVLG